MTSTISAPAEQQFSTERRDQFCYRMFQAGIATGEYATIYIGDRLGLYQALRDGGPATSAQLAARTRIAERYAREWLEQQASYGILLTDPEVAADERRFTLPEPAAEVLTDQTSLAYLGPLARMLVAVSQRMPELLEAYRTGGGVSWEQFGDEVRTGQAEINRPWFEHRLAGALAGVPDLHETLSRPGARIAEVGFGGGWASIALARAYPEARVDGYEVDAPSVEMARRNAAESGVADRVAFHHVDGAGIAERGTFDASFAFECVHDMAQPVEVLSAVRAATKPDGAVVVMDEAVGERFTAPGDDLERLMYGFSILTCLPDGRSQAPSAATGTVMRPDVLERYARGAGFDRLEVLPIEDFGFFRFYRLHH